MCSSDLDYASSISELNSLIEINELAIREVDGYLKHLITPIDDRYLEEVKCFTDNRREIQKILSEFQDKKRELEKIRKISVEYQNASMNRKDKFSSDKNGKVSSSNPNSEVASKTVGEKHRGSDITGLRKKNQQPPSPAPVQEDSQK